MTTMHTTSTNASTEPDCTATVNATMARWPATMAVFNRFGVDTCCGGGSSVEDAARRDGVDAPALCAALRDAVRVA
jgi:iron-sulfur cluster repair protein YtfE (RIC family)